MTKDHFASSFGFSNYEDMLENSTTIFKDGDISWCVSKLPHGKYLAWDDAEIADDRVEVFFSQEEAEKYLSLLRNQSLIVKNQLH